MSIQLFNRVAMQTDDFKLILESAFFLGYLGRYPESEAVFNAVLAMTPTCEAAMLGLGNLHAVRGYFADAESTYRNNLIHHPVSAIGHFYLAELLLGTGRVDCGTELLDKASAIDGAGSIGKMSRQLRKLVELGFFQQK